MHIFEVPLVADAIMFLEERFMQLRRAPAYLDFHSHCFISGREH